MFQLLACWPCSAYLFVLGFHYPGHMEHCASVRVDRWFGGMWDGRRWLQGQVVCCIPRPHSQHLQRVCKQLVVCPLRPPSTGLFEVRNFILIVMLLLISIATGTISSKHFVRHLDFLCTPR